jgi:hypothetical protein
MPAAGTGTLDAVDTGYHASRVALNLHLDGLGDLTDGIALHGSSILKNMNDTCAATTYEL